MSNTARRLTPLSMCLTPHIFPVVTGLVLCGLADAITDSKPRKVRQAEIHKLALDLGKIEYFEVNAIHGVNIDRAFLEGRLERGHVACMKCKQCYTAGTLSLLCAIVLQQLYIRLQPWQRTCLTADLYTVTFGNTSLVARNFLSLI